MKWKIGLALVSSGLIPFALSPSASAQTSATYWRSFSGQTLSFPKTTWAEMTLKIDPTADSGWVGLQKGPWSFVQVGWVKEDGQIWGMWENWEPNFALNSYGMPYVGQTFALSNTKTITVGISQGNGTDGIWYKGASGWQEIAVTPVQWTLSTWEVYNESFGTTGIPAKPPAPQFSLTVGVDTPGMEG